jgi:type 1 fimbriae regulatory protein FimB
MMSDLRHLISSEVEKLLAAVKGTRNAVRDRCLLLLMFRHGLRVSEACGLKYTVRYTATNPARFERLWR